MVWRGVPVGSERLQVEGWKDGGMEGWKRPMKVPFTHTGRKDILRPMSTIAFLEQERMNFFCHTVLGQGVQMAGQKDR